jgi:predicted nucleic acid-binding protein
VPLRKKRIAVVLDTNVVLGFYLSPSKASPNAQVFRLWRDRRRLQLILSSEVTTEYLEVLSRLGVAKKRVARLSDRLERREAVTRVNLKAKDGETR